LQLQLAIRTKLGLNTLIHLVVVVVGSKRATRRHCFAAWCGVVRGGRKRADGAVKSCDARVWTSASRWPLPAGKESDGNGAERPCMCVLAAAGRCRLGTTARDTGGELPARVRDQRCVVSFGFWSIFLFFWWSFMAQRTHFLLRRLIARGAITDLYQQF
jgi:hypothetical protein